MVRMPGLLDDERRRIRGFVAYLPTTALLDRVAEVPLPAWLVWASPLMGWVLFPLSLVLFHRMSRHYQSPGA